MAALLDRLQNTLPTSLPGSLTSTLSTTASGPFNAIVTGATGINGLALVKALTADSRFARVYACSRRPPPAADSVTHIPTDFLAPVEEIAGALGKAVGPNERIDYVFFATYKQEETEQANWDTNGRMLRSFLDAIESSGIAGRGLRRVVLTTGAKFYGVHLGPVKNPLEEDDGRVEGEGRPPNFYYHQEDIVKEKSAGQGWDWVVAMPNDVGVTLPCCCASH
jgi:nucleoside-diphosphate-sugar epimerase